MTNKNVPTSKIQFYKNHLKELHEFKELVKTKHAFPSRDIIIISIEKTEQHLLGLLRAAYTRVTA